MLRYGSCSLGPSSILVDTDVTGKNVEFVTENEVNGKSGL